MSQRRKLSENEDSFLKGDSAAPAAPPPEPLEQPATPAKKRKAIAKKTTRPANQKTKPTDIMSKILTPEATKESTTRFTADLPDSLHKRLTVAAAMSGKKKVDIIRELLDELLPQLPQ